MFWDSIGRVTNLLKLIVFVHFGQHKWLKRKPKEIKMNAEVTQGKALLPSGSPFGDPGPHGDLFQFLGPQKVPIFFKGPHFVYFRLKNALKVGASTTNYMWTIWKGEFSETRLVNENGTNLCTKLSHILWKCFFHYLFPLYFKKLARSDQF